VEGVHAPSIPGADSEANNLVESDVLTAQEVARFLRVNIKTVYEAAQAGTIPSVRLGRTFRFSRQAILASLQACKSASRRKGQ